MVLPLDSRSGATGASCTPGRFLVIWCSKTVSAIIDPRTFRRLATRYRRRWRAGLCAVDPEGRIVRAWRAGPFSGDAHRDARRLAVHEALRWGEPAVQPGPRETIVWAVPLLHNARLVGGLVTGLAERELFEPTTRRPRLDVRGACAGLLRLAEEHNLTNAALLDARRREHQRERTRAEAIHSFKQSPHYDLRAMYLVEEPALVSAIRKGERGQAREALNRLLVGMIHRAGDRLDLLKSFFMELVATMSRSAVEAGGQPEDLLGSNFHSIARLAAISSEEELARWLHELLERIMDSIRRRGVEAEAVQLATAVRFMADHCGQDISRNDAARAASMSPSHFSRQFRKRLGRTFTQTLNQMRTDRVAELLLRSGKPLKLIALECGFADQSYLTKVFRRWYRTTPARYRREHRGAAGGPVHAIKPLQDGMRRPIRTI